jgi:hypothetical protein
MGKVIKMNRSGTVGVSLAKEIAKEHGFVPGTDIEQVWSPELNAIVLKIALKPLEPPTEAQPPPAQESP